MSGRVRDAFAARGWEAWSADLLPSETRVAAELFPGGLALYPGQRKGETLRGYHYRGDVRDLFDWYHPVNEAHRIDCGWSDLPLWDLVIAFPPCTDLSSAGARYWKQKQADGRQAAAAAFFMEMVNAPAPYVAVENPRGIMGRKPDPKTGKNPLYRVPDQVVQPYWFGDPLLKNTCLWLKGLPHLKPDNLVTPTGRVATGGGSYRVDKRNTGNANNTYEDSEGRARRHILRSLTPRGFARAMADQWGPFVEEEIVT
jgi:site-specific DNA-cytosine methylase